MTGVCGNGGKEGGIKEERRDKGNIENARKERKMGRQGRMSETKNWPAHGVDITGLS